MYSIGLAFHLSFVHPQQFFRYIHPCPLFRKHLAIPRKHLQAHFKELTRGDFESEQLVNLCICETFGFREPEIGPEETEETEPGPLGKCQWIVQEQRGDVRKIQFYHPVPGGTAFTFSERSAKPQGRAARH